MGICSCKVAAPNHSIEPIKYSPIVQLGIIQVLDAPSRIFKASVNSSDGVIQILETPEILTEKVEYYQKLSLSHPQYFAQFSYIKEAYFTYIHYPNVSFTLGEMAQTTDPQIKQIMMLLLNCIQIFASTHNSHLFITTSSVHYGSDNRWKLAIGNINDSNDIWNYLKTLNKACDIHPNPEKEFQRYDRWMAGLLLLRITLYISINIKAIDYFGKQLDSVLPLEIMQNSLSSKTVSFIEQLMLSDTPVTELLKHRWFKEKSHIRVRPPILLSPLWILESPGESLVSKISLNIYRNKVQLRTIISKNWDIEDNSFKATYIALKDYSSSLVTAIKYQVIDILMLITNEKLWRQYQSKIGSSNEIADREIVKSKLDANDEMIDKSMISEVFSFYQFLYFNQINVNE